MEQIARATAQKIVETVKEVCGCDVNFIAESGEIIASTDEARIGVIHEGGRLAAQMGKTLEISRDGEFPGAKKGVNIPVRHEGRQVAVVGISGEPEQVRRFGRLAAKITDLLLLERDIYVQGSRRKADLDYLVRAAVFSEDLSKGYRDYAQKKYQISPHRLYRTLVLKLTYGTDFWPGEEQEQEITRALEQCGSPFCAFSYPRESILILPAAQWGRMAPAFERLAADFKENLRVGIGGAASFWEQSASYRQASLAADSGGKPGQVADFEKLDVELILGDISQKVRKEFLQKTVQRLDEEDLRLLEVYYEEDMSLQNASARLFIHKNSLQYQLNRIHRLCGYNPRSFKQAAVLYLAVKMKMQEEKRGEKR